MTEQPSLSRLIADMYDATLEPRQWSEVLARIVTFVGGHGGCLLAKDSTSRDIDAHWQTGVEPHYMQLYTETYSKIGPVAALTFGDVGQIDDGTYVVAHAQVELVGVRVGKRVRLVQRHRRHSARTGDRRRHPSAVG